MTLAKAAHRYFGKKLEMLSEKELLELEKLVLSEASCSCNGLCPECRCREVSDGDGS
jgi:hypothetical protein